MPITKICKKCGHWATDHLQKQIWSNPQKWKSKKLGKKRTICEWVGCECKEFEE